MIGLARQKLVSIRRLEENERTDFYGSPRQMYYSFKLLKGGYIGDYTGDYYRAD